MENLEALKDVVEAFEEQIGVFALKHKHGTETNCAFSTASDMHTLFAHLANQPVPHRRRHAIESDESTCILAAQILYFASARAGGDELVEGGVDVVAYVIGGFDEVVCFDGADDLTCLKRACWVAHPGVVVSVRHGRSSVDIVVETSGLHLFGKGDEVRW